MIPFRFYHPRVNYLTVQMFCNLCRFRSPRKWTITSKYFERNVLWIK